jgi:ACS family hexuronate transporter-like MFS transporter
MKIRQVPSLRWHIAVLLCFSTELNYLDRQTLSVLAATIQQELHLTGFLLVHFLVGRLGEIREV